MKKNKQGDDLSPAIQIRKITAIIMATRNDIVYYYRLLYRCLHFADLVLPYCRVKATEAECMPQLK
jgi:hypothetical protein